jgi:hypothetical protein
MKKYRITQRLTLQGNKLTLTGALPFETEAQMDDFIADLEGEVEVSEVIKTVGTDANVTSTNAMKATLRSPAGYPAYFSAYGKPFHFKSTVTAKQLEDKLALLKVFELEPTEAPADVYVVS